MRVFLVAAVQELHKMVQELQTENLALRQTVEDQNSDLTRLPAEMVRFELTLQRIEGLYATLAEKAGSATAAASVPPTAATE